MSTSFGSLIPSIENRESAWLRIRDRLSRDPKGVIHPTVTISREFGCEGHALAERLKVLLEEASGESWNIFDKTLVEKVASDERLSPKLLSRLGDESHAGDILKTHFGFPTHDEAYASLLKHLIPIAKTGCAIIVGRGGAVACQSLKNCFHFRLIGSLAFRAATIASQGELSLAEAEDMVRRQSKLREKFISDNLHTDITAYRWYDAVFNNERQNVETMAQACLAIMVHGWSDKHYFKHRT